MSNVLLATYPCGCWVMVHVLPASADDLADFYKQVAKHNKESEKKNNTHKVMSVTETSIESFRAAPIGGKDRGCSRCNPVKKKKLAEVQS